MSSQTGEYFEKLFVNDLSELERIIRIEDKTLYNRLQMSNIMRRLLIDEQPLAERAAKEVGVKLHFLAVEHISGNDAYANNPDIPEYMKEFAPLITDQTHVGGASANFVRVLQKDQYLARMRMILPYNGVGQKVTAKEVIKYFANKMGGVHADKNLNNDLKLDAEKLHAMNLSVSVGGTPALVMDLDAIAVATWRSCAPIAKLVLHKYQNDVALKLYYLE